MAERRRVTTWLPWTLVAVMSVTLVWLGWNVYAAGEDGKHLAVPAPILAEGFDYSGDIAKVLGVEQKVTADNSRRVEQDDASRSGLDDCLNIRNPEPNRLYLPTLCVSAPITSEKVVNNALVIPRDLEKVGLASVSAPLNGDVGVSVMAGHVQWNGELGVLYDLSRLAPGARVYTTDADGRLSEWVVGSLQQYNKGALPDGLYDIKGTKALAIVTCGGELVQLNDGSRVYEDNVVAMAYPVKD